MKPQQLNTRWSALVLALAIAACDRPPEPTVAESTPQWMIGSFEDDYGNSHEITAQTWTQEDAVYHIVNWNAEGQYLIARNDDENTNDGGLWTRIDWMPLNDMAPYEWGFCISTWNAASAQEAEASVTAQRDTPRTGCNGNPFSRMKAVESQEV